MTDREIELKLKKAVEACTPDVLEQVMAGCGEQNSKIIPMQKRHRSFQKFVVIAAVCAIFIGGGVFGLFQMMSERVASIVAFEVNPSIELKINQKEEIVEAIALNADAEQILQGMKLKGTDIHTATNAIIGSLLKNGYIDELANSILVSVEDKDSVRGDKLQAELASDIEAILTAMSVNASVLSQYVDGANVDKVSKEYEISHGKTALINRILEANGTYQFEELAALSVNELNLILSNSKNQVTGVQTTGHASDGAYIGAKRAKEVALKHAGISEQKPYELEVEIDFEHHRMVYEVEFHAASGEYEYDIDATTGEIVDYQVEKQDKVPSSVIQNTDKQDQNDRYDDDRYDNDDNDDDDDDHDDDDDGDDADDRDDDDRYDDDNDDD